MAVNFLDKNGGPDEKGKRRRMWVKTAATGGLVVMVVLAFGMLGAGVYIRREVASLADEEKRLQAEAIKLVRTEARVWQIDDRARVVVEEAGAGRKMAGEMRQVTPEGEVEIVGWGGGGGKGYVEAEADYPEMLEEYALGLRTVYPLVKVKSVTWSADGKWRLSASWEGGQE